MKFDIRKFLEVVGKVGPVVLASIPGGEKIAPVIPKVVEAIGEAEKIKGASGADKKQHVLKVLDAAIDVANTTGKVKIPPAEVRAIASQGIDTVIATVHVIEGAKVSKAGAASSSAVAGGTAAAAGSLPGVDTAPKSSDLPGGHATHGHGSSDDPPPAPGAEPVAGAVNDGNRPAADPPPSEEFEGGAGKPPTK